MDIQPLVSIIIPCYNCEQYVAEAIDSALGQTYQNIEVIVIDDGSTDNSPAVIRSYGDRLTFEQIQHQGACAARNRGLAISQGEYIQFLDADDLLSENKIEIQLPFLISDQADLVFCKGYIFGDGKGLRPKKSIIKNPVNVDPFIYCLEQGLSTHAPLHRRTLLEKISGFNEALPKAQEMDLHIRLGAINVRIMLLDQLLCTTRHHDGSRITRNPTPKDYMLRFHLNLAYTLLSQQEIYDMTKSRQKALASKIFQYSIYAFRNGEEALAQEGFDFSLSLESNPHYNERVWYKTLVSIIGILNAEKCLKSIRRIRDFVKKK